MYLNLFISYIYGNILITVIKFLVEKYNILVVGAGLSGAVIAERFANDNYKVYVIDKRDHIAGNCFDFVDSNNLLINKYGAHLFHTNDEIVWNYIQKFSDWQQWKHSVKASVDGKLVPIPVNIDTVNSLCCTHIKTEQEMENWLKSVQCKYKILTNSEEVAKSRVGEDLYKKIFKDFTFKQWNKYPEALDVSVLSRIPVRTTFESNYFDDTYQALPVRGYTTLIENMLSHPNITVQTNCDFTSLKDNITYDILIYTGPIDEFFNNSGLPKLEYRSIEFIEERYDNLAFYQSNSVVNYPSLDIPYTRIVEYKHFLNQKSPNTTIVKEFFKNTGDPFYPIPDIKNNSLYLKYNELASKEKSVYFIGRLANYTYFNMDQVIKNALDFYNSFIWNR